MCRRRAISRVTDYEIIYVECLTNPLQPVDGDNEYAERQEIYEMHFLFRNIEIRSGKGR